MRTSQLLRAQHRARTPPLASISAAHTHIPARHLQTLRRRCRGGICRLCLQRAFSPCMLHIVVSQPESELPPAFCRLDRALSLACSPARQPAPLWPILRATSASAETALVLGSPARYPRASPRPSPQLCPSRQRRASKRRPLDALALVPRSPSCPHPANPFLNPVPCTVFAWSEVPGRTRGASGHAPNAADAHHDGLRGNSRAGRATSAPARGWEERAAPISKLT